MKLQTETPEFLYAFFGLALLLILFGIYIHWRNKKIKTFFTKDNLSALSPARSISLIWIKFIIGVIVEFQSQLCLKITKRVDNTCVQGVLIGGMPVLLNFCH